MLSSTTLHPSILSSLLELLHMFKISCRRMLLFEPVVFSLITILMLTAFFLFFTTNWNSALKVSHLGFFISNSNYLVSCAGCCAFNSDSPADAKLKALDTALCTTINNQLQIHHIFTCCKETLQNLNPANSIVTWRLSLAISVVNLLLEHAGYPKIVEFPRSWMTSTISLAVLGANLHCLNLFLIGRDLPRWVMKSFSDAGFFF